MKTSILLLFFNKALFAHIGVHADIEWMHLLLHWGLVLLPGLIILAMVMVVKFMLAGNIFSFAGNKKNKNRC